MAKFTELDLMQMVSMPFDTKVRMSLKRIKDWAECFGEDKVYVSVTTVRSGVFYWTWILKYPTSAVM